MKNNIHLLLGMTFLILLTSVGFCEDNKGYNWEKTCNDNTCNLELFLGTVNVVEEGEWVKVWEAKSLAETGIFYVDYFSIDPNYIVTVTDFNYTDINVEIKLSKESKELNKDIPVKVLSKNDYLEGKETVKYEEINKFTTTDSRRDLELSTKDGYKIGDIIKVGSASTLLTIRDNVSGVWDGEVNEDYPTDDRQDGNDLSLSRSGQRVYMIFNLTGLSNHSTVNSANLSLYYYNAYGTGGDGEGSNFTLYEVYNYSWFDANLSWNDQPCGVNFDNSAQCNLTKYGNITEIPPGSEGAWGWHNISLTSLVEEYAEGYLSIIFKHENESLVQAANYYEKNFFSSEYGNITYQPVLNISYDLPCTGEALELDFDEMANITIIHTDGGNSEQTIEIYECLEYIGIGKVSITFNDNYQRIEFINDNVTAFEKNVHITDSPDIVQYFTVWDEYGTIENANVFIYELIGEDDFYLINSFLTDSEGSGSANLVSGRTYRIEINDTEHDFYKEDIYIVPSNEAVQNLILNSITARYTQLFVGTNCTSIVINDTCAFRVSDQTEIENITYRWIKNLTEEGTISYVNMSSLDMVITINTTNWNYLVNVSVDGVIVGSWNISYEDINLRDYQIASQDVEPNGINFMVTMLAIMVAAIVGMFADTLGKGTGIYAYGITLGLFSGVIGNLYGVGICIAMLIIAEVTSRLLTGE